MAVSGFPGELQIGSFMLVYWFSISCAFTYFRFASGFFWFVGTRMEYDPPRRAVLRILDCVAIFQALSFGLGELIIE